MFTHSAKNSETQVDILIPWGSYKGKYNVKDQELNLINKKTTYTVRTYILVLKVTKKCLELKTGSFVPGK